MEQHHLAAYLLLLAVGYWVLTLASKETKITKTVGQLIGWAIIVVSLCGAICLGACKMMACHTNSSACETSYACPYSGKMGAGPDLKVMDGQKTDMSTPVAKTTKKATTK